MEESHQHLVVLDVPGIKKYVFGTNRLVEIRGGSALLEQLNSEDAPKLLKKELGEKNFHKVFFGGGAGQFVADADRETVENAMKKLQKYFFKVSKGGLNLIYGISPYIRNDYARSLNMAFMDLKIQKEEAPLSSCTQLHTGFIRECDSCADMASPVPVKYGGETRMLCKVCAEKVEQGRKSEVQDELKKFLKTKGENISYASMARTFEDIGKCCRSKEGYTALVYADGNAMGKLIKQISTLEDYRFFSQKVDEAVKTACYEAIYKHCRPVNGKFPAIVLLLGGDDLLVYMSADTAMPFAVEAARRFEEITGETFAENPFFLDLLKDKKTGEMQGLTISMGIAYGKSHTPFPIMFSQSEELLKSAKTGGSEEIETLRKKGKAKGTEEGKKPDKNFYSPSYIDYHITPRFNQLKVSDSRKNHLQISQGGDRVQLQLHRKPYSLKEAEALLKHAENLIRSGIPSTRLKRFGYAPFLGKMSGTLECLNLYVRTKEEQRLSIVRPMMQFKCFENMPWEKEKVRQDGEEDQKDKKPIRTMLTDLMEIVEFCPAQPERR